MNHSEEMKIYRPRKELRPYVRYYWTMATDSTFGCLTFPIGCPQIIFHRGTPLYIPEIDRRQTPVTISGQVNFPAHIRASAPLEMIVAVFYPHTIGMFIDTPPSAFYNLEISGYDIPCIHLRDTAHRIFDCYSLDGGIDIMERWLMARIKPSLNTARIGRSVGKLMGEPSSTVGSLASTACLGTKQFGRLFLEHVGMHPKEYIRIVRFQRAMWMLQRGDRDYAGIAAYCGYADQSHFIREFRLMSGFTPGSLAGHAVPYSDLFTDPV